MDEKLIALAKDLKADRKRARRIGVILGLVAIAAPFVLFGLMPLGGLGGSQSPWGPLLLPLMYVVIVASPAFVGAGFALLNVGLALRGREKWLKEQAKIESPSATEDFLVRRRRDARILFIVAGSILFFEIAAFLGLTYLYNVNKAWEHAQKGPISYPAPLTELFFRLTALDGISGVILLAAGAVLVLAAIAVIRRNRAIVLPEENTNGETDAR